MQVKHAPTGAARQILVAEDEQLMRHALGIFLKGAQDLEVVAMVENGAEAVEAADRLRPDVVLMDIHMPVMDGIEATRRIRATHPEIAVIALTTLGSVEAAVPMLQAGAQGYLLKDCTPETLVSSIRQVLGGDPAVSQQVTVALLQALEEGGPIGRPAPGPSPEAPSVTDGEMEILTLLAAGHNTAEMAAELYVAEATVKSRLGRLCSKFGVDGRVRLLVRATELGLVEPRLDRH